MSYAITFSDGSAYFGSHHCLSVHPEIKEELTIAMRGDEDYFNKAETLRLIDHLAELWGFEEIKKAAGEIK